MMYVCMIILSHYLNTHSHTARVTSNIGMVMSSLSFLFASGLAATSNTHIHRHSARLMMVGGRMSSSANSNSSSSDDKSKRLLLCLHGRYQSGSIFRNKIAGARRKLEREYELHFLDGPILLNEDSEDENVYAWYNRDENGKHTLIEEAFDYVIEQTKVEQYDAIIGFSQGGTLATALAVSGVMPSVRVVCTAGAPCTHEVLDIANKLSDNSKKNGLDIPKLHLAGETDSMVSVESTKELVERGGNGQLIIHDQGHLFPTRSARVKEVLDFLAISLKENAVI